MSDPKTLGVGCSFEISEGFWCGNQNGTRKDPRQERYDIGLCPRHMRQVLEVDDEGEHQCGVCAAEWNEDDE